MANINIALSIVPQYTFVKKIGGDKVNITLMVKPGASPHTYEPKPSQMIALSKADLYFSIGVEFEDIWLSKFKSHNPKMHIADLSLGIQKIKISKNNKSIHHHEHDRHHKNDDPHIWTSPKNVKTIAQNIYHTLIEIDPKNSDYYKKNLDNFIASVARTDKTIKSILSRPKGDKSFMVLHPSWGYFAKEYGLKQIVIEAEGKSPKPKSLINLIQKAKKEKVNAVFVQPEFSDSSAKLIAKELGIPVIKISPLAKEWSKNLITLATSISGQP